MSTLGEKVTESIVNAIGKGAESAALGQHKDVKALIDEQVNQYLENPNLSPSTKKQFESMLSDSTVVDFLCTVVGLIGTLMQTLLATGEPYAEYVRQGQWRFTPVKLPPEPVIIQGLFRGRYDDAQAEHWLTSLGYDAKLRDAWYVSQLRVFSSDEIRELYHRGVITMPQVHELLKAAGYGVQDQERLVQIFLRIPGAPDLIRMAVREAFTPEIAERFGQYEDFPAAFAEWGGKQGLSAEWCQRYWASHWDLPSMTQGYEMLHRGVISEADLDMLMRAQDVMPFWRPKLKQICYTPFTRVDIRRMYHAGVLDEDQVYQAYRDIGYDDTRARSMVAFTKLYYGPDDDEEVVEERDFTKAEILDGYRKGILTADQTRLALGGMGYPAERVEFYISREDLKATQELKGEYLSRYKILYVEGIRSADEISADLAVLGLPEAEVNYHLGLWYLERIRRVQRPTRAELARFFKGGIITEEIWTAELQAMGYSDRYISWYLADILENPELAILEEE